MRASVRVWSCLLPLVALLCAPVSWAQGARTLSGSIGATSDFVFRGLSYTQGKPAVQVSLDMELASRVYVGGFVSTVNPNDGPSPAVELDFWAGKQWEMKNGFTGDLRFTHYMYPDDPRLVDYDRDEVTATFGFRNFAFFSATYSTNTDAVGSAPGQSHRGDTWAFELSARRNLTQRWSFGAGVGQFVLDDLYYDDYKYWSATLSADYAPWELHFAVLGAEDTAEGMFGSHAAGDRAAVTVLYRFSTVR
jgi:uncharacterized protein (TIGR02001 family)